MASLLNYKCDCGYQGDAWVGSTRATHGKSFWFPFMCLDCEAVTSVDVLAQPLNCPDCCDCHLLQFGVKILIPPLKMPWAFLKLLSLKRWREIKLLNALTKHHVAMAYEGNKDVTYGLFHKDYPCPKCKEDGLRFSLTTLVD